MATYTDQFVVYESGSIKKIAVGDTLEVTSSFTIKDGAYDLDIASHDGTNGLKLGGTLVSASAAELNALDGATDSNNTTGKAAILGTDGSLTIAGNLTVNGTTTTIESTTLTVDDKNIELGTVATPTDSTADGGGITLKGATDKTFNWVDATDSWTSSEHLDLASAKEFKIAGTSVLSATALGSAVVSSSLTSVGTLTSLIVDSVSIDGSSIGLTTDTDLLSLADGAVTVNGSLSATSLALGGTDINATAAEINILDGDTTATSTTIVDADRLIVNDNGSMVQVAASDLKTYFNTSVTASSIAADDIAAGDASVTLETSSGSVDIKDFGQGSTQLGILATNSQDFASGNIVTIASGASGGLSLADKDGLNVWPVGVAIEASLNSTRSGSAANIDVVTIHGSKVSVSLPSSNIDLGGVLYLGDDGQATASAPTSGQVWRLGFSTEDHSGTATTSCEIIWMPQFIADLG